MADEIAAAGAPACDVVVPVHNGFEALRRGLAALARHTREDVRIVLVDDASTDPRVRPLLAKFAARPGVEVLENARNLGFSGTVNRALATVRGDAVILNADTEVGPGWLEGLARCRRSDSAIGIVCPVSNNATLLSLDGVERLFTDSDGAVDVDALAACVARAAERTYPRIPTAVGFCMWLTRELLDRVGTFDPAFGRGYGEENDLSMRALDAGFEIACCDDVYVHHAGEASFGTLPGISSAREANRVLLERRWPAYAPGVAAWWRAGGIRRVIERVNAAAERERFPGRPRVLQVVHRFEATGGVEEHTRALINHLKHDVACTVLVPGAPEGSWADFTSERLAPHLRIVRMNTALATPGVRVLGAPAEAADPGVEAAFRALLAGAFDVVHIQSPVGWNTLRLPRLARESGSRVVLSMHDHAWMCADYNMMTGPQDLPCGRHAARGHDAGCVACIGSKSQVPAARAGLPIAAHLEQRFGVASESIAAADAVVCPSRFMEANAHAAFGHAARSVRVIGHGVPDFPLIFAGADRPMLRVAIVGRFSGRKGAHLVVEAARRLAGQRIVFEAWGPVEDRLEAPARAAGVLLRGRYAVADLPRLLLGIDLVLIPSTMGESYCLVLSEVQRLGIPVAVSANGAMTERVRPGETGFVFPAGDVAAMTRLLVQLRDDRAPLEAVARHLRTERPKTLAENAREYLSLYRELAAATPPAPSPGRTGSIPDVQAAFGLPRERRHTRLGDDAYDAWLGGEEGATAGGRPEGAAVIAFDRAESAAQLNRRIAECASEWAVLHDAADTLAPNAIQTLAAACAAKPRALLAYADHDSISATGDRYDPVFKPSFSPELLRHAPYIAGVCALRVEGLVARGGLRAAGWDGVVEYALRLAESNLPDGVLGVRGVLVHRSDRALPEDEREASARSLQQATAGHLARSASRAFLLPAAADAPAMWAHATPSRDPICAWIDAGADPAAAAACITMLHERCHGRLGEVFVHVDAARWAELESRLVAAGRGVHVLPVEPEGAGLAQAFAFARRDWLLVIDARCQLLQGGWLERLEQGVAGRFTGAIAPDLRGPGGAWVPGWEVLGAGPWSVSGPPPAMHGPGSLVSLYRSPREVTVLAPRLVLVRREAATASGAAVGLREAGRYAIAHLCLALGDAGFDCLSRPFVAGDWHGPWGVPPAARGPLPSLEIPDDVAWMRERWGARLVDDPRFHPAIGSHEGIAAAAPRFPSRSDERRMRVCAFPFDRWGSGELRVRQPLEALQRAGRGQVVFMPEHHTGRAPNALAMRRMDPDVIYAHNFFHDYQLQALAEYARHSRALRVLGMDDLLTVLPEDNPYALTIYPDIAQRIARAVELCDRLIVSTAPLAEAYGRCKDVRVVPNGIDLHRWQGLENRPRGGPRPRVGWAGARQHAGDLRLLEPVVAATADEIDWVFFGMCTPALAARAAEVHDMVPIGEYPRRLAALGLDVAVAPLRDHPFNHAKSALRLLEYGILGLPVVASRVLPYEKTPATLVDAQPEAWIAAVRCLARDRDGARAAGEAMRAWVMRNGILQGFLDDWTRALDPGR